MPRRRHYAWKSETDLAAHVVTWLRETGWTVYQEIKHIDIVATKDNVRWAIECKRAWNLAVLAQAAAHTSCCHYTSIAIPSSFPNRTERFGLQVAKQNGIGVLGVKSPDKRGKAAVREQLKPTFRQKIDTSLDKWLVSRAENYSPAGSPSGSSWTPFKETCARLKEDLQGYDDEPQLLGDVCRRIDHHYETDAACRQNLARVFRENNALGFHISKNKSRLYIALTAVKS